MKSKKIYVLAFLIILVFTGSVQAAEDPPEIAGLWYGSWALTDSPSFTSNFSMTFLHPDPALPDWAVIMYVPGFGLFNELVPATIEEGPGAVAISIGVPGVALIEGVLEGRSLSGTFYVAGAPPVTGTLYAEKYPAPGVFPGAAPGPECDDLPPLYCTGDAEYCSELVPFEPSSSLGGINPPYVLQTDPSYGYIRRDLMMVVQYATAKVACKTADWEYGSFQPLGLLDMSESGGGTPSYPDGSLRHPQGTHVDGNDIDTAYYQLYTADNLARPVGVHHLGYSDQYHLVEPPYTLDEWRVALYVAYLSEHPRMRLIAVDGQVGLVLEETFDDLVELGWLDADARETMPLGYEVEDQGYLLYQFHHHHMHLSITPGWDLISSAEIEPQTLNRASQGNTITAYLEPNEGLNASQIDPSNIALILDDQTVLYADSDDVGLSDYNDNGVADLTVKFDRQQVLELIEDGTVQISITGSVDGQFFEVSDTVYVIGTSP